MFVVVVFRVRLTIEVEDITRYIVFNAFDHVMVDVAVVDPRAKVDSLFKYCIQV
jgi:hypothetical protein